jgi:ribonuclease HII
MSEKKNNDWISAVIVDDSEDEELKEIIPVSKKKTVTKNPIIPEEIIKEKIIRKRIVQPPLKTYFDEDVSIIECGIDEAGRGPMFGRVYAGLVVLPKDDSFDHFQMKDSKKFHSKNKKKIEQVAEYIKENAIAWAVEYEDEQTIDEINILQATQSAMHKCIKTVLTKIPELQIENILLLVDGNYFKPYTVLNKTKTKMETIRYQMIEGGDNKYTSIAAASILAKVARDTYINDLCALNPELIEHYGIDSNKGYGSKKHMDGIKQHGITKWHRKTFGICKEFA